MVQTKCHKHRTHDGYDWYSEDNLSLLGQMSGRALQRTWDLGKISEEEQEVNRTGKTLRQEEMDEEREWTRDVMRGHKTR